MNKPDRSTVGQHLLRAVDPRNTTHQLREIDQLCLLFEDHWEDNRYSIESMISQNADIFESALLEHLLAIDLELRWTSGKSPVFDEYTRRFPAHAALVSDVFIQVELEHKSLSSQAATKAGSETDGSLPLNERLPKIPGYQLLGQLGRGGMGVVYRATQLRLNREVALKIIAVGHQASKSRQARFLQEGEIVAGFAHPNIAHVYDAGEAEGLPYLASELVEGGTLADVKKPLIPPEAVGLVAVVAEALAIAHDNGIVHRDIKPANILLADVTEGIPVADRQVVPKITDFGLASRIAGGEPTAEHAGGTPDYMAPEQLGGDTAEITRRTDIHALGILLFELLTGTNPFRTNTMAETLERVRNHCPPAPSSLNTAVPATLDRVCKRCLEKDPARRFATASELAISLRSTAVRAGNSPAQNRNWHILVATLLFAALLCLGTVIRVMTNEGEIVILSEDPNVEVLIRRNGNPVKSITARDAKDGYLVRTGDIEIVLLGTDATGHTIDNGRFSLQRGKTEIVTIQAAAAEKKSSTEGLIDAILSETWGRLTIRHNGAPVIISKPEQVPVDSYEIIGVRLPLRLKLTESHRVQLAEMEWLATVDAAHTPFSDDDAEALPKIPHLEEVDLFGSRVTPRCISSLGQIRNLRYLSIGRTKVSTADLARLRHLRSLNELNLTGPNFSERHVVDNLKKLRSLKTLQVVGCNDEQLAKIAELSQLEKLRIYPGMFARHQLGRLADLPSLGVLDFTVESVLKDPIDLGELKSLRMLILRVKEKHNALPQIIPGQLRYLDITGPIENRANLSQLAARHPLLNIRYNGQRISAIE